MTGEMAPEVSPEDNTGQESDETLLSKPYALVRMPQGDLYKQDSNGIAQSKELPTEPGPGYYEISGHKTIYHPGVVNPAAGQEKGE